jgi:hypothetical protein
MKHAVLAAMIAATTVLIGDMLKPPHAGPHRPHDLPDPESEQWADQVRHQQHRSHGHRHGRG